MDIDVDVRYWKAEYSPKSFNGLSHHLEECVQLIKETFSQAIVNLERDSYGEHKGTLDLVDKSVKMCEILTSAKLYSTVESQGETESKKHKRLRLLSQYQIVEEFHQFVNSLFVEFLNILAEKFSFRSNPNCDDSIPSVLIDEYFKLELIFYDSLKDIRQITDYVYLNYPQIGKETLGELIIDDYYYKLFVISVQRFWGTKFNKVVGYFFDGYNFGPIYELTKWDELKSFKIGNFLRSIIKNNLMIDGMSPIEFYEKNLFDNAYINHENKSLNEFYLELNHRLILQARLAWHIDSALIHLSTQIILRRNFYDKSNLTLVLKKLIESTEFLLSMEVGNPRSKGSTELFSIIYKFYENLNELDLLKEIIKSTLFNSIYLSLKSEGKNFQANTKFLYVITRFLYFSRTIPKQKLKIKQEGYSLDFEPNSMTRFIKDEYSKIIGGDFKIIELYQKLCQNRLKNSQESFEIPLDDYDNMLFISMYCLEIDTVYIENHLKYLFRKFIMSGSTFWHSESTSDFEKKLLYTYEQISLKRSNEDIISSFIDELETSCDIGKKYFSYAFKKNPKATLQLELVPIVLKKDKIPITFPAEPNQKPRLPPTLESRWLEFENYYKSNYNDKHNLHFEYSLHHCEVSSPYILPNGEYLTFQLTLYQSLLLDLFNEKNEISIEMASKELIIDINTVRISMQSFLDCRLVKETINGNFEINDSYEPDLRRVKENKLRIGLPKATTIASNSRPKRPLKNNLHKEGSSSQWKLELLSLCIVRSLKGQSDGVDYDTLFRKVEKQYHGVSIGEFKEALNRVLTERSINQKDERFFY
ncbi:hypothetical protein Kpol_1035p12 [Vanderwaltozyma polyspora DSM 70294]|uniref:Cullin family profile domain-containing protein n=1 Tax=Vanderwaltozyma polyspora (strain ATCC 22028 / DSM 70294 / BCRC 21397 / CBS 2163 / NBRC 10782 / NRRL Y-8283 / UCD 57-17) TaxID=436907 RepID=A7TKH8_VANPO|nr:uncharacterized protein Kpol_1035p12 [Vanderwaltozyma polyspora DSM 70294]EDO17200.1 hypothetical protein Kpol_1035p12 [Vanderwaltozyma polyspora DSM 70294]